MGVQQVENLAPPAPALAGNFRSLRDMFFHFRGLIAQKHIAWHRISDTDANFIKQQITFNAQWTAAEAYRLHQYLLTFAADLRKWGHDVYSVEPPMMQAMRPSTVQQTTVVRHAAVSVCDHCLLVYLPPTHPLHAELRDGFKGRTYDTRAKEWRVPFEHATALLAWARRHNVHVGDSAERFMEAWATNLQQSTASERVELEIPLKMRLFDYQTVGVDFSMRVMRSLVADQMGLGKTPTGIATAVALNRWPILVVCPKSLRANWQKEIHQWTYKRAQVGTDKVLKELPRLLAAGLCDFLIVNYEAVEKYFVSNYLPHGTAGEDGRLTGRPHVVLNPLVKVFKGIIVDEAHEVRNPKVRRYSVMHAVMQQFDYRQLLTGSPFVNTVHDLAALVTLLGHMDALGGEQEFKKKYGKLTADAFIKNDANSSVLRELNTKLRTHCMIRREKHQVLRELPDKFRTIVPLELSNRKDYDHAYISFQDFLAKKGATGETLAKTSHADALARLMLLKRLSVEGKMAQAQEYVGNLLAQGEKVIVFVWHLETVAALRKHFPHLLEISGNVSDEEVERGKGLFQSADPQHNLIVITYKRGGVGHTLTASSNVVFLELGWNPKDQDQAEDRAHRIGQKSSVTCHYLLGKDTVDEWIYELIQKKRQVHVESTGSTEQISVSIESALLDKIRTTKAAKVAADAY